jgi:hypothetical protein
MFENVRQQDFELDFYIKLLKNVMSEKDLKMLRHKSKYDSNN